MAFFRNEPKVARLNICWLANDACLCLHDRQTAARVAVQTGSTPWINGSPIDGGELLLQVPSTNR